jgi:hypothetical protein
VIQLEYSDVSEFTRNLQRVPVRLRPITTRRIRAASTQALGIIRGRYGWSTRIPGAVKLRVGYGERKTGVLLYVDQRVAPHARPIEGISTRSNVFRHPVHGNRDNWVAQPTRPSFLPGVRQARPIVIREAEAVVAEVFRTL